MFSSPKMDSKIWFSFSKEWYFESIFSSKSELLPLKFSKKMLVAKNTINVNKDNLFFVLRNPESIKIPVKIKTWINDGRNMEKMVLKKSLK